MFEMVNSAASEKNAMPIPTEQLLMGLVAAATIAAAARYLRALSRSGAIATTALGTVVFGFGGVGWAVPLLAFFILSSVLSHASKRFSPRDFTEVFEKGGQRDAGQVLANGGIAGAVVLLNFFYPNPLWYAAFVGGLAAAAADTWGTEIGVLGRGDVRSVLTFSVVPPGTSGGVSLAGSIGCVAGAAAVACSGAFFANGSLGFIATTAIAGVIGSFADSLVGGTLQASYRCPRCGTTTERRKHCGVETELASGIAWVNNDAVNIACCVVGGAVAALVWWLAASTEGL